MFWVFEKKIDDINDEEEYLKEDIENKLEDEQIKLQENLLNDDDD